MQDSVEARRLWPYIARRIEKMLLGVQGSGSAVNVINSGGAPSPHAFDSEHHVGAITNDQGPQFLLADGSRPLTGGLSVSAGVQIDGVDISAHAADAAAHHAPVTVLSPVALAGQQVSLTLATNPGLENVSGLRVRIGVGLGRDATGIFVQRSSPDSGLTFDLSDRLTLGTPTAVTASSGNTVSGVSHTHTVDSTIARSAIQIATGNGLTGGGDLTANRTLSIDLATDPGLEFDGVKLRAKVGTGILRQAAGLAVNQAFTPTWTGAHRFEAMPTVAANLRFDGSRTVDTNGTNDLTMAPTRDLFLSPTQHVYLGAGGDFRTGTFSDLATGIAGFRLFDRGSNVRQLSIAGIKTDEFYAKTFVADLVRIDRGSEYWSKGFGVVQSDFVLPADEATVLAWFEDAPSFAGDIFAVGDWLLIRSLDYSSGLSQQNVWMRVVSRNPLDGGDPVGQQRWTLRHKAGGVPGRTIKAGTVALNVGASGQGWVHLSALNQDSGPFVQVGDWTSDPSVPANVVNRVRMGKLDGVAGYTGARWGFAAGNNLGLTPATGFSGLTAEATDGLRLSNVDFTIYAGTTPVLGIDRDHGLRMLYDNFSSFDDRAYVSWHENSIDGLAKAYINAYYDYNGPLTVGRMNVWVAQGTGGSRMDIIAGSAPILILDGTYPGGETRLSGSVFRMQAGKIQADLLGGTLEPGMHIRQSSSGTGLNVGMLIEQHSTGDAKISWVLGAVGESVTRAFNLGIDNSDNDWLKLSGDIGGNVGVDTLLIAKHGQGIAIPTIVDVTTFSDNVRLTAGKQLLTVGGTGGRWWRSDNTKSTDVVSGSPLFRLTKLGNVHANLVRVSFIERTDGNNTATAQRAFVAYVVLGAGTTATNTFATTVTHALTLNRKLAVVSDTTNGWWDFKVQTTADADVLVEAEHEVTVEVLSALGNVGITWYP